MNAQWKYIHLIKIKTCEVDKKLKRQDYMDIIVVLKN